MGHREEPGAGSLRVVQARPPARPCGFATWARDCRCAARSATAERVGTAPFGHAVASRPGSGPIRVRFPLAPRWILGPPDSRSPV